jgi:hypothetical protein
MEAIFEGQMPRARLAALLKHFSRTDDDREPGGSCIHSLEAEGLAERRR